MLLGVFTVTDAEAAAIRAVYEQGGELAAAVELRRLFPAITDNTEAQECVRTIAAWKPLPVKVRRPDVRIQEARSRLSIPRALRASSRKWM